MWPNTLCGRLEILLVACTRRVRRVSRSIVTALSIACINAAGRDWLRAGLGLEEIRNQESKDAVSDAVAGHQLSVRRIERHSGGVYPVSYTHLRAHETRHDLVC